MCLSTIAKRVVLPESKAITAYKVFNTEDVVKGKGPLRFDCKEESSKPKLLTVPAVFGNPLWAGQFNKRKRLGYPGNRYHAGFHAYKIKSLAFLETDGDIEGVYEVQLWGNVTFGKHWGDSVVVGDQMKIVRRAKKSGS